MSRSTVTFVREALYAEVWREPLRTVARRHALSDVGLRKICHRLGVPTPPVGYWSKVASGNKPPVAALPSSYRGDRQYILNHYVDDEAPERELRTRGIVESNKPTETSSVLKKSVDACLPVVKRTAARLNKRTRDDRGLMVSHGGDVFVIKVSDAQKERALLILDAVLNVVVAADGKVHAGAAPGKNAYIVICGEKLRLEIKEKMIRTERSLTAAELKEKRAGKLYWIRDRYSYVATGHLSLSLLSDDGAFPAFTMGDKASRPLEQRVDTFLETLTQLAAEQRVRREMREEQRGRWEEEAERRRKLVEIKRRELERLEIAEKEAVEWDRAKRLRGFACALEEAATAKARDDDRSSEAIDSRVRWLRNAADWLDPLVKKRWPQVDDAPDW